MVTRSRYRIVFLQLLLWGCAAAVVAYFAYHAVHGERGLTARKNFDRDISRLQHDLAAVQKEREEIETRVLQLRTESVDRDLLDELARDNLGVLDPADRVLILNR